MISPARKRWRLLAAAGLGLCLLVLAPSLAVAADRERTFDPTLGVVSAPPAGVPIQDEVLDQPPPALRRATASAASHTYTTADGSRVRIAVSDGYVPDAAADQALADFLGSLLHGPELNQLRVFVATPGEIPALCGGAAAACYTPRTNQMVVVGQDSYGGLPTDYVIAHEYGHHIENHRRNTPFAGGPLLWGTKRWATEERICPGVITGRYSLSTAGQAYFRNPGEAFAESFAYYHYPGRIPWEWVDSLRPHQPAYTAIRQDVLNPWRHNVRLVKRGGVSSRGDRRDVIRFATPLDGGIQLDLRGPRRGNLDLALLTPGGRRPIRVSTGDGSREHVGYTVCGVRRFKARISAVSGGGSYRLLVTRP